jgi:hypothetical protein
MVRAEQRTDVSCKQMSGSFCCYVASKLSLLFCHLSMPACRMHSTVSQHI